MRYTIRHIRQIICPTPPPQNKNRTWAKRPIRSLIGAFAFLLTVAAFGLFSTPATSAAYSAQNLDDNPLQAPPLQANSYNLQVEWQSDSAVLLTWDAPVGANSKTYYRVRRMTDADGQRYRVIAREVRDDDGDGRLSYIDESAGLTQEQSYLYGVRAFNFAGKKRGRWTKGGVRLDPPTQADDNAEADTGDNAEADTGDNAEADTGDNAEADTGDNAEADTGDNAEADTGDNAEADTGDNAEAEVDAPDEQPNTPKQRAVRAAPIFSNNFRYAFSVVENLPANTHVGTVVATDADSDPISYSLAEHASHVGDSSKFAIDSSTGIITTTESFDYEKQTSYTFYAIATAASDTTRVRIEVSVTNVKDSPDPAPAPTGLRITTPSDGTLKVFWTPPTLTADMSDITGYLLFWQRNDFNINSSTWGLALSKFLKDSGKAPRLERNIRIEGLEPGEEYRVYVQTYNGREGGKTPFEYATTTGAKRTTIFTGVAADGGKAYTKRLLGEKLPVGTNVGDPITAVDPEGDTLTYSLTSGENYFTIDPATGQLTSAKVFDCTVWNLYIITVAVTDNLPDGHADATRDYIDVTIGITEGNTGVICPFNKYYR